MAIALIDREETARGSSAWISSIDLTTWLPWVSHRPCLVTIAMRTPQPASLVDRLVGPGASVGQIALILIPALMAGLLCGQVLAHQNASDWAITLVALLAIDLIGGCIACSLPPLQRWHRSRYCDPLKQAGFQLSHAGHVIAIAWLLSDGPTGAAAMGLSLLFLGAVGGAMCSRSVASGFRVVLALAWPAYAAALPGSSPLFVLLSLALAFKLFVALPSFERQEMPREAE